MKVNNIEFELDVYDTESLKKIEEGQKRCNEIIASAQSNPELKVYEKAQAIIDAVVGFFEDLLGEDLTNQILVERRNFLKVTTIYAELIDQATQSVKQADEELAKFDLRRLAK